MVEQSSGYVIGPAREDALVGLPEIERAAGAIFAEEDLPARMREHVLSLAFFEAAAREGRLFVATEVARKIPVGFAVTTRVVADAFICYIFIARVFPFEKSGFRFFSVFFFLEIWEAQGGFHPNTYTSWRVGRRDMTK